MSAHVPTTRLTFAALILAGALGRTAVGAPDAPTDEGTSARSSKAPLVYRVYPVGDLVLLSDPLGPGLLAPRGAEETRPGVGSLVKDSTGQNPAEPRQTGAARLMELITGLIERPTWDKQGGPGSIEYHPLAMALSVKQTADIQEQVEELLAALRRLQEVDVAVEVRVFRLPESFLERLDLQAGPAGKKGKTKNSSPPPAGPAHPGGPSLPACLNDRQVRHFLEAVRADEHADVLQSPRLTVAAGHVATISLTDRRLFMTGVEATQKEGQVLLRPRNEVFATGFRLSVRPVVSGDRRSVRLSLTLELADLDPGPVPQFPITAALQPEKGGEGKPVPVTQSIQQPGTTTLALQDTLTIPDGRTVLLGGWSRPRADAAPARGGRATEHIVLMVTPRIIIPEEEEAREKAGDRAPKP